MKKLKEGKITMEIAINDPRNRGYHIIVVGGKLFKARTGENASRILDKVRRDYPKEIPAITYIPDADTLFYGSKISFKDRAIFYLGENLSSYCPSVYLDR